MLDVFATYKRSDFAGNLSPHRIHQFDSNQFVFPEIGSGKEERAHKLLHSFQWKWQGLREEHQIEGSEFEHRAASCVRFYTCWHLFNHPVSEESCRWFCFPATERSRVWRVVLPRGPWCMTGGFDANTSVPTIFTRQSALLRVPFPWLFHEKSGQQCCLGATIVRPPPQYSNDHLLVYQSV